MRTIGYYDNPAERLPWQKFLRDYDPRGVRVSLDMTGLVGAKGTILEQRGYGPGAVFMVKLDKEHYKPFFQYASEVGITDDPKKMKALYLQLKNFNCIIEKPYKKETWITCIYPQWIQTEVVEFKRGLPIEYQEEDPYHVSSIKSTPGIVQKVYDRDDKRIVELFLFEPMSWFRTPYAIDADMIRPEHISRYTNRMVVRDTYNRWKELSPETLPPGKLSDDGKEYILDEPIELKDVQTFCDRMDTDEMKKRCWLGAAMFHVVPIIAAHSAGTFRPMRWEMAHGAIPYVVTKEDIEGAMEE